MLKLFLVALVVLVLLLIAELMWRVFKFHTEITRKFVHITVGTFVAFWSFFLSWGQIELLAAAFFVVVAISRLLSIFGSIHLIGRKTIGELIFAVSIALVALIAQDKWIFMVAMLHLSLADGLAAVVGSEWGNRFEYKIFGHKKSLVGSLTFFACSFGILAGYFAYRVGHVGIMLAWMPFATAGLENIGVNGTDNLLVPVFVASILRLM